MAFIRPIQKSGFVRPRQSIEDLADEFDKLSFFQKMALSPDDPRQKAHIAKLAGESNVRNIQRAKTKLGAGALSYVDTTTLGLTSRISKNTGSNFNKALQTARESHPIASTIGGLAGYVTPGIGFEKATSLALKPVLKGVTSTLGKKAIKGAAIGAGLETTEGLFRGESALDVLKRTGAGAALGAALGAGGEIALFGTASLIKKIAEKIRAGKALTSSEKAILKSESLTEIPKTSEALPDTGLTETTQPIGAGSNTIQKQIESVKKPTFVIPEGQKEVGFAKTVRTSEKTAQPVKEAFEEIPATYRPITEPEYIAAADKRIADNLEDAVQYVKQTAKPSSEHTATALRLIERFQNEGNFDRAIELVEDIAPKLTKAGQAIQAANIYGRLSPESILMTVQKRINKINSDKPFFWTKDINLTPESAGNFKKLAEGMKNAATDAERIEASQILQEAMSGLEVAGLGKKISTAQTIFQLFNPKTLLTRNPVGNEIFFRLERLNKYVASPIDFAKSKLTGAPRTITFRTAGQGGYWEGLLKGAKAGWKGVNPSGITTQFDISGQVFKGKFNPMTYLEKALGATLKGFDFASYNRAVNQTIGELATLRAINRGLKGTAQKAAIKKYIEDAGTNVLDIADQYGKYVTFQDDNVISKSFSAVKKALNVGKDFGLGDIVAKYPKTPGSLMMRGIEYSPAGFLRSAYLIAKPLLKGSAVDSREVLLALSRAITGGIGLTGLGYFLSDVGIITGQSDKDPDKRELERQTGAGSYKINTSALYRWVKSGFNKEQAKSQQDDILLSYDWAQPIAMSLSFGANINKNIKENQGALKNTGAVMAASLEGALNTITEQPMLQGIMRMFQGYDFWDNVTNTLASIPASFVPTLSNQAKQLTDNISRNVTDEDPFKQAVYLVKNKIPGLSKTLPEKVTTTGETRELYQGGSNNALNVFLNPAFVTKYNTTPGMQMILDIYEQTGEKKQFPRTVAKKITIDSVPYELTKEQINDLQRMVGTATMKVLDKLAMSDSFRNSTAETQIEVITKLLDRIGEAGRKFIKAKYKIGS